MIQDFYYKAQALDNTSPDHYKIGSNLVGEADDRKRSEITRAISEVARKGRVLWENDGAELIVYRPNRPKTFLIQVYSEGLDQAGRCAPLLCCGAFHDVNSIVKEILSATEGVKVFAKEIGRSVDPRHSLSMEEPAFRGKLEQWEDDLKKKRRATQVAIAIGTAAIVTMLALAIMKQLYPSPPRELKTESRSTSNPTSQR